MLPKTDAEAVRQWLTSALADGKKADKTAAGLAVAVGASAQAVNGWRKTGRITKSNLELAARYFGYGPSFALGQSAAEPAATYSSWPFTQVTPIEIRQLTPQQRERLEALIRLRLDEWAQDAQGAPAGKVAPRPAAPAPPSPSQSASIEDTMNHGTKAARDALAARLRPPKR